MSYYYGVELRHPLTVMFAQIVTDPEVARANVMKACEVFRGLGSRMGISNIIQWGTLKPAYYNGLLMRAHPRLHEEAIAQLLRSAPVGSTAIDLGAGQGAFSMRLRDNGYTVTAVDTNIEDFKAEDLNFISMNFDDREDVEAFKNTHYEKYDVAIGMEVIEHVENPWEYCRLLISMVRPGGIVLITTPNPESILSRVEFLFTGLFLHFDMQGYLGSGHINPVTFHEFELISKKIGVEIVEMNSVCSLPWLVVSRRVSFMLKSVLASIFRPFCDRKADGDIICLVLRKPTAQ